MPKEKIFIVDDDPDIVEALQDRLEYYGYDVSVAYNGEEALKKIADNPPDLVLLDIRMPGIDGIEVLQRITQKYPGMLVVMLTAHGTIDIAVEAMKKGAHDFLEKPTEDIQDKIDAIFEKQKTEKKESEREHLSHIYDEIIGDSPRIIKMLEQIDRVANTDAPVLILGETGTGKELVASALHKNSYRAKKPFEVVQCGAIPKDLLESELFGHERGAFTGATTLRKGKFERADGGTLFFDEIGDMPLELQVKLLRAIEQKEFERVGGSRLIKVDVRIIAATNRNLGEAIEKSEFRSDLYYRLNMITINVPPLRERKSDIPILAEHFLEKYSAAHKLQVRAISRNAMELIMQYDWPGNVRELNNYIGRAVFLAESDVILPKHLPDELRRESPKVSTGITVGMTLKEIEKELILKTLEAFDGNRSKAAETVGISLRALHYKLKEWEEEEIANMTTN
ncbi:sigma-54-dependent Fis family transcriptional regulator [Candidatus Poribacteria bacterium]|nr:sigma-54-dependent Fis family transcriptional regulator [Candidatus Poribacteria bacterium]